jgi:hypothetical protein
VGPEHQNWDLRRWLGFLKVLNDKTIGLADLVGTGQYITQVNLPTISSP